MANTLAIHTEIIDKLSYFRTANKIPNIIFHGVSGSGKRTILNRFINDVYDNDREKIRAFVMTVNCAHGKGIKFIREELKFFAKTHIFSKNGDIFKSIILLNADKLTIDAQSALRRCIELFSHNTRFFIVVEDKYKLLKPILSRFCEIYIPEPTLSQSSTTTSTSTHSNLYKYILGNTFKLNDIKTAKMDWLKKELLGIFINKSSTETVINPQCPSKCIELAAKLYEKGYSGLDIIQLIESPQFLEQYPHLTTEKRYELLFSFHRIRKEFRNEKLLILFIIQFTFISLNHSLENISFM